MAYKKTVKEIIRHEKRHRALGAEELCDCDFAHDNGLNPQAFAKAKNYVDCFPKMKKEGMGLFLLGGPGAGKSYLAAEIVNELTDRGYNCHFTRMLNIISDLNSLAWGNRRSYINQICDRDLLVLDDLGAEQDNGNSNQILMQIIRQCHLKNVPIIVTTPYSAEMLKKEKGKRNMALARILRRCLVYTVLMPGRRRSQMLQKKRDAENMLYGVSCEPEQYDGECYCGEGGETTVMECLPGTVQQTLPLEEESPLQEKESGNC